MEEISEGMRAVSGVAAAMDWAASAWVVPHARMHSAALAQLRQLAQALPRTLALLQKETE